MANETKCPQCDGAGCDLCDGRGTICGETHTMRIRNAQVELLCTLAPGHEAEAFPEKTEPTGKPPMVRHRDGRRSPPITWVAPAEQSAWAARERALAELGEVGEAASKVGGLADA